jgi:hypothetical protein
MGLIERLILKVLFINLISLLEINYLWTLSKSK